MWKKWRHICGLVEKKLEAAATQHLSSLFLFFPLWKAGFWGKSCLLSSSSSSSSLFKPSHPGQLGWLEPRATFTSKLVNLEVLELWMKLRCAFRAVALQIVVVKVLAFLFKWMRTFCTVEDLFSTSDLLWGRLATCWWVFFNFCHTLAVLISPPSPPPFL